MRYDHVVLRRQNQRRLTQADIDQVRYSQQLQLHLQEQEQEQQEPEESPEETPEETPEVPENPTTVENVEDTAADQD